MNHFSSFPSFLFLWHFLLQISLFILYFFVLANHHRQQAANERKSEYHHHHYIRRQKYEWNVWLFIFIHTVKNSAWDQWKFKRIFIHETLKWTKKLVSNCGNVLSFLSIFFLAISHSFDFAYFFIHILHFVRKQAYKGMAVMFFLPHFSGTHLSAHRE